MTHPTKVREELPVIPVKNVLCCCLCYLQDWMAATLPTQTWTSPSWVWPASILHVAFTLGQESRVMLGTVWSQAHVPAALTSPKEILWACRTGTDQHPLSYLLDIETNKLWSWQSYSILVKGFCGFFFTNRYSWIYFPRCRPQRLQADIVDHQFVSLQQYSKNRTCLLFQQKSLWTISCFAETYLYFCDFHGLRQGFTSPFQAISSQLSYSLG